MANDWSLQILKHQKFSLTTFHIGLCQWNKCCQLVRYVKSRDSVLDEVGKWGHTLPIVENVLGAPQCSFKKHDFQLAELAFYEKCAVWIVVIKHDSMNMIYGDEQFSLNTIVNEHGSLNMIFNEHVSLNMIFNEH